MGEFQREKQVQVQSEKVREKPAEAKELCLVSQWNQYNDLHYNERTESLIDHKKSLLISRSQGLNLQRVPENEVVVIDPIWPSNI